MTLPLIERAKYQGLRQIFQYNRSFYLRTLAAVVAAIILSVWLPSPLRTLFLLASGVAIFWICSSLLISHYVYDRSALYSLRWLHGSLSRTPERWIGIHTGFDETSRMIGSIFPDSQGQTLDIYDPQEMTEPSIEKARRLTHASSTTTGWRTLPFADQVFDAAFLIFAAHEIRRHDARARFFQEVVRVLRRTGEVVLVEHLRDWPNFLAFGPGFLHFFSESTWQRAASAGGLSIERRFSVTPFVHVFVLRRLPVA